MYGVNFGYPSFPPNIRRHDGAPMQRKAEPGETPGRMQGWTDDEKTAHLMVITANNGSRIVRKVATRTGFAIYISYRK